MILGLVVDGNGHPICTEMWPGKSWLGKIEHQG
jgi:hypothetical protein